MKDNIQYDTYSFLSKHNNFISMTLDTPGTEKIQPYKMAYNIQNIYACQKKGRNLFNSQSDIPKDLFYTRIHTMKSRFLNTDVPKLANV